MNPREGGISPEEMSPVLLTGATGFVGKHVLPALLAAGYAVRCASRRPARAARDDDPVRWVELSGKAYETVVRLVSRKVERPDT
jgi:uncharacterized protein YbjT (DUF2867 family)